MWAKYLNFPTVGWVSVLLKIQQIGEYLFITGDQRIRGNGSNERLIVRTMFGGWILGFHCAFQYRCKASRKLGAIYALVFC